MKLNVFIDGACRGNPGPASVGVCFFDEAGKTVREYYRAIGETTNNVAEYTAMVEALRLAQDLKATELKVHSDSQLLVRQISGRYRVKNARLSKYILLIKSLRKNFKSVEIVHVPREQNQVADALANKALDELKKSPIFVPSSLDAEPEVRRRYEVSRDQNN